MAFARLSYALAESSRASWERPKRKYASPKFSFSWIALWYWISASADFPARNKALPRSTAASGERPQLTKSTSTAAQAQRHIGRKLLTRRWDWPCQPPGAAKPAAFTPGKNTILNATLRP